MSAFTVCASLFRAFPFLCPLWDTYIGTLIMCHHFRHKNRRWAFTNHRVHY
uniref:Uncharacterized protein n=1 Tax=Anguilla anguilla TaxID=7936 RepID=A0A0E9QET4_ANGAN